MKTSTFRVSDNGNCYSKYSTDTMRVHSNVGFHFGTKAAQNATNKWHVSVYI